MTDYTVFRPCEEAGMTIEEVDFSPNAPYAMAYVRVQRWERPLAVTEALRRGTAFRSLVKPFGAMEVE